MGEEEIFPLREFPFRKGVDALSGLKKETLSFFLKYYCPTWRMDDIQQSSFFESIKKLVTDHQKEIEGKYPDKMSAEIVFSGSAAEGLLAPPILDRKTETGEIIKNSDFDMLRVIKLVPVIDKDPSQCTAEVFYLMEQASQPGFVKLRIYECGNKEGYLHSQDWLPFKVVSALLNPAINIIFDIVRHGPAWNVSGENMAIELDHVYALECRSWPCFASMWKSRQITAGWLDVKTVANIIENGCHLVPIGNRSSPECNKEWRLSFSLAEQQLAKQLNSFQKKAYIIVKLLHREYFSFPKLICTYHLKTVLLWTCEKLHGSFWCDENMAECVLALLDQLITFVAQKNIPNFFIPENNMLSSAQEEFVQTVLNQMIKVRTDPLNCLLKFDQKYRLFYGPKRPWIISFGFFAEHTEKVADDDVFIHWCALQLSDFANLFISRSGLCDWAIQEGYFFLKESWGFHQLLSLKDNSVPSYSWISYCAQEINKMFNYMAYQPTLLSIKILVAFTEYTIFSLQDSGSDIRKYNSEFCFLYGLAAILNHCCASCSSKYCRLPPNFVLTGDEIKDARIKSKKHYIKALEMSCDSHGTRVEYSILLYQNEEFDSVIDILKPFIKIERETQFQHLTSITKVELCRLEESLENIAGELLRSSHPKALIVPTVVIAY